MAARLCKYLFIVSRYGHFLLRLSSWSAFVLLMTENNYNKKPIIAQYMLLVYPICHKIQGLRIYQCSFFKSLRLTLFWRFTFFR